MASWALGTGLAVVAAMGCRGPVITRSAAPPPEIPSAQVGAAVVVERPRPSTGTAPAAGIACGETRCAVGAEVCCGFGEDEGCARRFPDDPANPVLEERFASQLEACRAAVHSAYSFDQLTYCDDSADCPAGKVCCSAELWGGAGYTECRSLPTDGSSPCQFNELCEAGKPCGLPGTRCIDGLCRRSGIALQCGAQRCSAPTAICCVTHDGPICTTTAQCAPAAERFSVACRGPSDCAKGERCCEGVTATYCSAECINAATVCTSPRDCPRDYAGVPLKACRPDAEAPLPLNICDYGL